MHISSNEIPSDPYGAVTDVAGPLLTALNKATMQESTYSALLKLVTFAKKHLEKGIKESLDLHLGTPIVSHEIEVSETENELPQSHQDEQTPSDQGGSEPETGKPATDAENAPAEDSTPKAPETPAENVTELAPAPKAIVAPIVNPLAKPTA